jgi:hypothetical protein
MKITQLCLLVFTFCAGYGQNVIDVEKNSTRLSSQQFYVASGFPVSTAKYVKLTSGSPYFSETWMKGTVFITDSTVARNVRVRLDLLEGSLLYLDADNAELISVLPVVQVSMTDTLTGNKYVFINSSTIQGAAPKIWYQVLAGQKFTLLKEYHKEMLESKAYASSVTEQTINTDERYFIGFNNSITRIKKLKDITELAGNKKQQLLDYIDKNKLNGKKEADLISLVEYYHTLE